MKKHICLIGDNLSHSLSKEIYEHFYECICTNLECNTLPDLHELAKIFDGIAITSPFKYDAAKQFSKKRPINFVDNMCNTYLTDADAFMENVKPLLSTYSHVTYSNKIYVLGHGAMAEMVERLLSEYEVVQLNSREPFRDTYPCLGVINCSRAKEYYHIYINHAQFYYDMNYNKGKDTSFIEWMKFLNPDAATKLGYHQLITQCDINMQIIGAEKKNKC